MIKIGRDSIGEVRVGRDVIAEVRVGNFIAYQNSTRGGVWHLSLRTGTASIQVRIVWNGVSWTGNYQTLTFGLLYNAVWRLKITDTISAVSEEVTSTAAKSAKELSFQNAQTMLITNITATWSET